MANAGEIRAQLVLENQAFQQRMADARQSVQGMGGDMRNLQRDLDGIKKASLIVGGAVVVGIGASVKVAADFEQQMDRVAAISQATGSDFERLKETALDLGQSTSKSASEVAKSMEDMAAMGFNVNEIIAAMPGVISAAEASGTDLATTAGIVAAALNGFQMEASDATKVADVLAMTANVSAANVSDLGYAFKYAAPIANTLGISMEELAAATGIMVDAGLEGSQAGTSLRMALLRLASPTNEGAESLERLGIKTTDAEGNFLSLSEILPQFADGLEGMTDAQKAAELSTIFSAEAVSGMLTVIDAGPEKFNDFTGALEESAGISKETADIMMDNLKGSFEEFSGALETLGITVGEEFLPMFTKIVEVATDIVKWFGELDGSTIAAGLSFAGVASAIGLVAVAVGKLTTAFRLMNLTPTGWIITGIALLGGALAGLYTKQKMVNDTVEERVTKSFEELDAIDALVKEYDTLSGKMTLSNKELARFVDINDEIKQTVDPGKIEDLRKEQEQLLKKSGLTNDEMERFLQVNADIIEKVPESNIVLTEQGNILLENADAAREITKARYDQMKIDLEILKLNADAEMVDNLAKQKEIMDELNRAEGIQKGLIADVEAAQLKVNESYAKYLEAKEAGNEYEAEVQQAFLESDQVHLDNAKKALATHMENTTELQTQLDTVNTAIGKYDEVNLKLIDLELRYAGINGEATEGLQLVDDKILKLQGEKALLQTSADFARLSKEEQRESITHIDGQIESLKGVKRNIIDIVAQANDLNHELSKSIVKNVVLRATGDTGLTREFKHTGGLVGRGQIPNLHVGGNVRDLIERFANRPMHNELDVRLLRNEMVLTEAQQANLMRMIDAGLTGGQPQAPTPTTAPAQPIIVQAVLSDGRVIAEATYPDINRMLYRDQREAERTGGRWRK